MTADFKNIDGITIERPSAMSTAANRMSIGSVDGVNKVALGIRNARQSNMLSMLLTKQEVDDIIVALRYYSGEVFGDGE